MLVIVAEVESARPRLRGALLQPLCIHDHEFFGLSPKGEGGLTCTAWVCQKCRCRRLLRIGAEIMVDRLRIELSASCLQGISAPQCAAQDIHQ